MSHRKRAEIIDQQRVGHPWKCSEASAAVHRADGIYNDAVRRFLQFRPEPVVADLAFSA